MSHQNERDEQLARLKRLFGEPAIFTSESRQAYDELLTQLADALKPRGFLGWMLLKELADQSWEINRFQQSKARTVEIRREALVEVEAKRLLAAKRRAGADEASEMSKEQQRVSDLEDAMEGSVSRIDEILDEGRNEWAQSAAMEQKLAVYEILDRLQAGKILQRNNTIEQLAMHNEILEQRGSRKPATTIEGECAEVPVEEAKIVPPVEGQQA